MVPRHRSAFDFATKAISHNEFIAVVPLIDKARDLGKVMASISVAQDDEFATRYLDTFSESAAISLDCCCHNARSVPLRQLCGFVSRAVVGDHNLTGNSGTCECCHSRVHAIGNGTLFVETRNYD